MNLRDLSDKLDGHFYGHYIAVKCLFHNDENPSMLVFEDGYHCMACGASGGIEKLLKKIKAEVEPRASEYRDFRNPFSRWLRQFSIADFCHQAHASLKRWPDLKCYLKKRDIDQLIDDQLLGFADGWYIFPVRNRIGDIVTAVARAGEAIQEAKNLRYLIPHDAPQVLYIPSHELISKSDKVYVTFGIIDSLILYSMGLASVSGLTGKSVKPELFDAIRKPIEIIPDFGEEEAARKLASHLGWRGNVKRLDYPEDCKDVADVYHLHGVKSLVLA